MKMKKTIRSEEWVKFIGKPCPHRFYLRPDNVDNLKRFWVSRRYNGGWGSGATLYLSLNKEDAWSLKSCIHCVKLWSPEEDLMKECLFNMQNEEKVVLGIESWDKKEKKENEHTG